MGLCLETIFFERIQRRMTSFPARILAATDRSRTDIRGHRAEKNRGRPVPTPDDRGRRVQRPDVSPIGRRHTICSPFFLPMGKILGGFTFFSCISEIIPYICTEF